MKSEEALQEAIFQAALQGCDADVSARRDALWDAAVCLQADVLRSLDPFSRERRLRGLVAKLRKSIDKLEELLKPVPPRAAPRNPYDFSEITSPESTT
jgi:hypothetical protein